MKPVALVGQAPSRTSDPTRPFSGRSGRRLSMLAGRDVYEWADCFNLLDVWPGRDGKGDACPRREANLAANVLSPVIFEYRTIIFCGRNVADAFGYGRLPFLGWCEQSRVGVIPHPSGIVRWWNDPENVKRAQVFLRQVAIKG